MNDAGLPNPVIFRIQFVLYQAIFLKIKDYLGNIDFFP
jgi:hypothetical protein